MVIDQIDVVSIAVLEAEDDAPVTRHRHGPQAFELALERMEPKAGKRHVSNVGRFVKAGQYALDLVHVRR